MKTALPFLLLLAVSCAVWTPGSTALPVISEGTVAFAEGSDGCHFYRIPAMTVSASGGIIVAADRRYESLKDIGMRDTPIDIAVRRSGDGGRTWGQQQIIARGEGVPGPHNGYGDPSLYRTKSGRLLCVFASGEKSFFGGIRQMAICSSDDDGATWSQPRIIPFPDWVCSAFVTSGTGFVDSDGTILASACVLTTPVDGKRRTDIEAHLIHSEDDGDTWTIDRECAFAYGDESKLEKLSDGRLLLSARRRGGQRGFNTAVKGPDGRWHWGKQWNCASLKANPCNADILRFSRKVLLHTYIKDPKSRRNLTLAASTDEGASWRDIFTLQPLDAAYSTMVLLPGGDVGVLYEDGSRSSDQGYDIVFKRISHKAIRRALR